VSDIEDHNLSNVEESLENEVEAAEGAFIDILTGDRVKSSPKKLLVQKVLRQLIDSYGFDRNDLEASYRPRIRGKGNKVFDIGIFRPGTEHTNDNIQRIVVCQHQKQPDKLRSISEAEPDLRKLKELMELTPSCHLGMWTNGFEEFFVRAEHTRFEVRFPPLGVWPAPGEETEDLDRTGGPIQVSAEADDLQAALERCHRFLNRNLGLDHRVTFQQLAILLLAKMYDETRSKEERRFWIKGEEPFSPSGQAQIAQRIGECLDEALRWQPGVLARGWGLHLEEDEVARVVMELARYSLSETHPKDRTSSYRSIVRTVMDGREGRYPTPLNVAEMAVQMLDPKPSEHVLDCSSGTGTFLAMIAAYLYDRFLTEAGTNYNEASREQLLSAQENTAEWAKEHAFACEIDPFLAATTRMNLLVTSSASGRAFRLDAQAFPFGDLDGVEEASRAAPLGTMDVVLTNPWFSTQQQDVVTDSSLLSRYDLGKIWERTEDGDFRNTGRLNTAGVPPEVLFLERALKWAKPGTGRVGILLPDGLLGNPSDEYVRSWILTHCQVIAVVDLPIEPFKVTGKEYKLTPALSSFLLLRRRSDEELMRSEYPEYWTFMAIADRAGVDPRGKPIFQRAADGAELVFDETVIERVRVADDIQTRTVRRRSRRIHDELPMVAQAFGSFMQTGEVNA
jgi:type I restriction enzyme M protein